MTHNEYKGLGRKWYNYSTVIIHMSKTDTEKEGTKMSDTTRIVHKLRRTDKQGIKGAFAKLRKATFSFMSVSPHRTRRPSGWGFHEILNLSIFRK